MSLWIIFPFSFFFFLFSSPPPPLLSHPHHFREITFVQIGDKNLLRLFGFVRKLRDRQFTAGIKMAINERDWFGKSIYRFIPRFTRQSPFKILLNLLRFQFCNSNFAISIAKKTSNNFEIIFPGEWFAQPLAHRHNLSNKLQQSNRNGPSIISFQLITHLLHTSLTQQRTGKSFEWILEWKLNN